MANEYPVGSIKVWNTEIPVIFESQRFRITYGGQTASAATWDELEDRAKALIRRSRVKVAIEFIDAETGRRGTATGRHATRGVPRIEWADGEVDHRSVHIPLRPDTDVVQLQDLKAAARAATEAVSDFIAKHSFGKNRWSRPTLDKLVTDAIEQGVERDAS